MPSEDLAAYQRHTAAFVAEYHPKGATESHLVQSLADSAWRMNRIAALESNILALSARGADPIADALAIASAFEHQSKALANLSLHSQRLSRQFERTAAHLAELQKARRTQEAKDLEALLDIMQMYEGKGETYNPTEDGFVFTEPEIAAAIRTRNRKRLADQAYRCAAA
jgi:hypothetical protein